MAVLKVIMPRFLRDFMFSRIIFWGKNLMKFFLRMFVCYYVKLKSLLIPAIHISNLNII